MVMAGLRHIWTGVRKRDWDPKMHLYINKHHSRCEPGIRYWETKYSIGCISFQRAVKLGIESMQYWDVCVPVNVPCFKPLKNNTETLLPIHSCEKQSSKGMAVFKNTFSHSHRFYMVICCIPEAFIFITPHCEQFPSWGNKTDKIYISFN